MTVLHSWTGRSRNEHFLPQQLIRLDIESIMNKTPKINLSNNITLTLEMSKSQLYIGTRRPSFSMSRTHTRTPRTPVFSPYFRLVLLMDGFCIFDSLWMFAHTHRHGLGNLCAECSLISVSIQRVTLDSMAAGGLWMEMRNSSYQLIGTACPKSKRMWKFRLCHVWPFIID